MNFCPTCGKNETWCPHLGNTPAPRAAPPEPDAKQNEIVYARNEETGRVWLGRRGLIPRRYSEIGLMATPLKADAEIQRWRWNGRDLLSDPEGQYTLFQYYESLAADLAESRREVERLTDAASKGTLARQQAAGMEAEIAELRRGVANAIACIQAIRVARWLSPEPRARVEMEIDYHHLRAAIDAAKDAAPPETGSAPPTGEAK